MHQLGEDLGERLEHEAPLVQPRVREHRGRAVAAQRAHEQDVDVDRARPVGLGAHAAELPLDGEAGREQLLGRLPGLAGGDRVQEEALRRPAHGLGQVERAQQRPAEAARLEPGEGARDRGLAIAEVGSETEHDARLHALIIHGARPPGEAEYHRGGCQPGVRLHGDQDAPGSLLPVRRRLPQARAPALQARRSVARDELRGVPRRGRRDGDSGSRGSGSARAITSRSSRRTGRSGPSPTSRHSRWARPTCPSTPRSPPPRSATS